MPFDHAGHLCGVGEVHTWHRCSSQPTLQLIPALITMLAGSDLASESSTQGSRRPQQLIRIGTRIESVGSSCLARAAESYTSPCPGDVNRPGAAVAAGAAREAPRPFKGPSMLWFLSVFLPGAGFVLLISGWEPWKPRGRRSVWFLPSCDSFTPPTYSVEAARRQVLSMLRFGV